MASSSPNGVGTGSLSEGDMLLHSTLAKMAQYVRKTRLQINPFFADFDRHKSGAISWSQFSRVLATAGFQNLTQPLVDYLSRHYALETDPTKVSYKAFIKDIENVAAAQQAESHASIQQTLPSEEETAPPLRPLPRPGTTIIAGMIKQDPSAAGAQADDLSAEAILKRLRAKLSRTRQSLESVFSDFDPLRKHRVTRAQFSRCLTTNGVPLTETEINIIANQFPSKSIPDDVDYYSFAQALSDIPKF